MNTIDLQEASRDAQRALEEERDRCVDRVAELDGYLKVMDMVNDLIAENAWVKIAASNFRLGTYKDANGQLRPCYQLTKTECLYIATKFNGKASAYTLAIPPKTPKGAYWWAKTAKSERCSTAASASTN